MHEVRIGKDQLFHEMARLGLLDRKTQVERLEATPMILGLDVSTSTIGWSLLTPEGFLPIMGFIPLGKEKNLYSKAQKFVEVMRELAGEHNIQHVFIEEDLKKFKRGLSSARTLQMLSRFNGMVSLMVYREMGIEPVLLNVNEARKTVGVVIDKKDKTLSTKEKVLRWNMEQLGPEVHWPTKILKSGPRKGLEVRLDECGDMSDAYVICKAGQIILREQADT